MDFHITYNYIGPKHVSNNDVVYSSILSGLRKGISTGKDWNPLTSRYFKKQIQCLENRNWDTKSKEPAALNDPFFLNYDNSRIKLLSESVFDFPKKYDKKIILCMVVITERRRSLMNIFKRTWQTVLKLG